MRRKISWMLRIIYNFIRLPIIAAINIGHFRFGVLQKIAIGASFITSSDGYIKIGNRLTVDSGTLCRASHGIIEIGSHVYINRNCNIISHKRIKIGEKSTIGPNVCIYDHDHDFRSNDRDTKYITKEVIIGKNVWIGANAIILKGVTIGDNAVIAAGAIITTNIPERSIAVGKPNLIIKPID